MRDFGKLWRRVAAAAGLVLLAGCASIGGLQTGTTTAAQVEAQMGPPEARHTLADGSAVWFYAYPVGRRTWAVTLGADGVVRAIEQRLERAWFDRLRAGESTREQVRALLGPPQLVSRMDRQMRDVWEYTWTDVVELRVLWVQFSYDGVVRELLEMHDFRTDPPTASIR